MNIIGYAELYRTDLLNNVIPFWLKNSRDQEFGGYFTCLDRQGKVFDSDKFTWLQCRQVWCFSMLYNKVEKNEQWLDFAIHGAEFLKKHGRDAEGNWYFSLTREGRPLVQPYNIFSDCFAAMGFGQLYRATGKEEYGAVAFQTFQNILSRQNNSKGKYTKSYPDTRPLQSFSMPMILCNLVLELEHLLDPALVNSLIEKGIHSVMNKFYQPQYRLILEHVTPSGEFSDSFEGRLINPGHGLEAMWFIMELATRTEDKALINKAKDISLNILEYGWDNEHGGIFYFRDIKGYPPQQLEWDQKLWWVHVEALVCMLKGYFLIGDERCWNWFEKIHRYTWDRFPDKEYGEWFGYLSRQGEILLPLKGGKWKGCFHIPRSLYQCWKTLEGISERSIN
ncbi:MAG: AGE family epimerase/isomerase [Ferruginibacter sp.]